ncbi:MAG: lysophospholipid acyltransferase family protein [Gemmatimonadetes bacterium]|nr:lysophospholipid acyltransferase family protein [Gemmatimonadota bacterium]
MRSAAYLVMRSVLRLLARTWRVEVVGVHEYTRLRRENSSVILATWHATLLPVLLNHGSKDTSLLVSSHRDGGYLVAAAQQWGYRSIRGSSTRLGVRGALGMLRTLRDGGEVGITPDGPRGPARVAKPGAVFAAQKSGACLVPIGAFVSKCWRLRSWDGFVVPRPFARVRIVYGDPIAIPHGRKGLQQGVRQLQWGLECANRRATC